MISLPEALASYPRTLVPLPEESIPITDSLNRVLSQPVYAKLDLPRFTQSAMDGYALISSDTAKASDSMAVRLRIAGEIPAGPIDKLPTVQNGECWRILTGGSVPRYADSIAPQEVVEVDNGHILIRRAQRADRNIRHRGEELKTGELLASAGQRITPGLQASLIMAGNASLKVRRRPRIRVLITGDELRPVGSPLREGETIDSNGPLIRSYLLSLGYPEPQISHVGDILESISSALCEALNTADLVITTGGVSVGDRDFIPSVAHALGVEKIFWKVSQKPGKPLFYGKRESAVLLGLPGNPGAVLIGLLLHVRHVLDCLEGKSIPGAPFHQGFLTGAIAADALRDRLVRVEMSLNAEGCVQLTPLGRQDSHMLSNLGSASALAHLPMRQDPYPTGSLIRWTPLPGMCSI